MTLPFPFPGDRSRTFALLFLGFAFFAAIRGTLPGGLPPIGVPNLQVEDRPSTEWPDANNRPGACQANWRSSLERV